MASRVKFLNDEPLIMDYQYSLEFTSSRSGYECDRLLYTLGRYPGYGLGSPFLRSPKATLNAEFLKCMCDPAVTHDPYRIRGKLLPPPTIHAYAMIKEGLPLVHMGDSTMMIHKCDHITGLPYVIKEKNGSNRRIKKGHIKLEHVVNDRLSWYTAKDHYGKIQKLVFRCAESKNPSIVGVDIAKDLTELTMDRVMTPDERLERAECASRGDALPIVQSTHRHARGVAGISWAGNEW